MADIRVSNEGTVFTFWPLTQAASSWIAENLNLDSWQWFGGAVVVDHRFAGSIIEGMIDDGLEVK